MISIDTKVITAATHSLLSKMPSGNHLTSAYLQQVWYGRVMLLQNYMTIFENIFRSDALLISVNYLKRLCALCDNGEYDEKFLGVKLPRTGGPELVVDDFDVDAFVNIFADRPQTTLKRAREVMCEEHYDAIYDVPSIRSFGRVLKRRRISRKVMERVHYLRCPILRGIFMDTAGAFDGFRFLDIDETLSTYKEFFQKYGYAPKGEIALKTQFQIDGRQYSSIAAYSSIGLIAYRVVEGCINAEIFQSFLENEVAEGILPGMIGLFDNAAIHHTPHVRGCMEEVFEGYYLFVAPYSPDLKPVEKLFAEVKDLLRYREDEAVLHPIATISEIFELFRPGMLHSGMAENHFNIYTENHDQWLAQMAAL